MSNANTSTETSSSPAALTSAGAKKDDPSGPFKWWMPDGAQPVRIGLGIGILVAIVLAIVAGVYIIYRWRKRLWMPSSDDPESEGCCTFGAKTGLKGLFGDQHSPKKRVDLSDWPEWRTSVRDVPDADKAGPQVALREGAVSSDVSVPLASGASKPPVLQPTISDDAASGVNSDQGAQLDGISPRHEREVQMMAMVLDTVARTQAAAEIQSAGMAHPIGPQAAVHQPTHAPSQQLSPGQHGHYMTYAGPSRLGTGQQGAAAAAPANLFGNPDADVERRLRAAMLGSLAKPPTGAGENSPEAAMTAAWYKTVGAAAAAGMPHVAAHVSARDVLSGQVPQRRLMYSTSQPSKSPSASPPAPQAAASHHQLHASGQQQQPPHPATAGVRAPGSEGTTPLAQQPQQQLDGGYVSQFVSEYDAESSSLPQMTPTHRAAVAGASTSASSGLTTPNQTSPYTSTNQPITAASVLGPDYQRLVADVGLETTVSAAGSLQQSFDTGAGHSGGGDVVYNPAHPANAHAHALAANPHMHASSLPREQAERLMTSNPLYYDA